MTLRILPDTSIWIDHIRKPDRVFADLLDRELVFIHPAVVGEVALGSLSDRTATMRQFEALHVADEATDAEVLRLVENGRLWGRGIGWIDAHLIASAIMTECVLATRDKRLKLAAFELGIAVDL